MKPTLFSNSQRKVARSISAMRVSRKATRSYWRGSFFSTVPSPNQPPARKPASVTALPLRDTVLSLTSAGRHAGPGIEPVATVADISTFGIGLFDNAAARLLEFALAQVGGPERNLSQAFS